MQITFEQEYLRELFVNGRINDKHHRFQPQVVRGYQKAVNYLQAVNRIEDLFLFHSLHFEALHGNKEGVYSIRANNQYRVEFELQNSAEDISIKICNILDLSNHYQ